MKKILLTLLVIISINVNAQLKEMRAVWVTNVDSPVLLSDESISAAMDYLASININVIFPVVWNKGYTLFPSEIMDSIFSKPIWPTVTGRDPLKQVILEAHRNGIEVIPWFEFGFSPSYSSNGGHILAAFPSWAGKNNQGQLLVKNGFDWMAGTNPEVQNFMISLITELLDNYDVDGVQGDDRLPAMPVEGGYDSVTVAIYKSEHNGAAPPQNYEDTNWKKWRADKLTEFFARMKDSVKSKGDHLIMSVAPSPYPWGFDNYLQDSKTWLQQHIPENMIPQLYRDNLSSYQFELLNALNYVPADEKNIFFAGVLGKAGSYVITPKLLLDQVGLNRQKGVKGESIFFYEALRANDNQLGDTLASTFYADDALLPYRGNNDFRPKAEIVNEEDSGASFIGNWELRPVMGYKPNVYWTNDTNYAEFRWDFDVPAEAWYDVYTFLVPNTIFTANANYTIFSMNDSINVVISQKNSQNKRWVKIGTAYITTGNKTVVKLDNTMLEPGKFLLADAVMLMINRKLSPDVVITSIKVGDEDYDLSQPSSFLMLQNYPNPFNPSTKIKFSVPNSILSNQSVIGSVVSLKVYDVLGREIKTLLNEEMNSGEYEITFDGNNLASGIYYCVLRAGDYSKSIKLVLMK